MNVNPLDFLEEALRSEPSRHSLELTASFEKSDAGEWVYTWEIKDYHDDEHPDYMHNVSGTVLPWPWSASKLDGSITLYLDALSDTFVISTRKKIHVHFYHPSLSKSEWKYKFSVDKEHSLSALWRRVKSLFS